MRICKKQENKNLFGGTLCINLIINTNTGPKNLDRVNEIYKNENDWAFLAKVGPKYTENTAVNGSAVNLSFDSCLCNIYVFFAFF